MSPRDEETPAEEQVLRDALRRAAPTVDSGPDLDDLARRRARANRRRAGRVTVSIAAALFVVFVVALGLNGAGDSDAEIRIAGTTTTTEPPRTYTRTLDDGTTVELRVDKDPGGPRPVDLPDTDPEVTPWYEIPGSCMIDGTVTLTMTPPDGSTVRSAVDHWAGVTDGTIYFETPDIGLELPETIDPVPLDDPAQSPDGHGSVDPIAHLWVVQTTPNATSAKLEIRRDGEVITDSSHVVGGLAVIHADVPGDWWVQQNDDGQHDPTIMEITTFDADDHELGSTSMPLAGSGLEPDECLFGPTELPAPGPEQPVDATAAAADVERAFQEAIDLLDPDLSRVEEGSTLRETVEEVQNLAAGLGITEMTLTIQGIVFADRDTAYVRYTIDIDGPDADRSVTMWFTDTFGVVRRVGGSWQLTRASACEAIDSASQHLVSCPETD